MFLHNQHLGIQLRFDRGLGEGLSKRSSARENKKVILPFLELKGMMDLPFEMVTAPYLGLGFFNEYYLSIDRDFGGISAEVGKAPVISAWGERDLAFWTNYKNRALKFYEARVKRGPFIFNFDQQILEDQFQFTKKDIMRQFDGARAIYSQSDELFATYRHENPYPMKIKLSEDPYDFVPLSEASQQYKVKIDDFHKETKNFYKQDTGDWSEILF